MQRSNFATFTSKTKELALALWNRGFWPFLVKTNGFNVFQFACTIKRMHSLREGDGTLLDNCVMNVGLRPRTATSTPGPTPNSSSPAKAAARSNTGRFLPDIKGNQGDLLGTLLTCAGIPLDRPIDIATRQLTEMIAT